MPLPDAVRTAKSKEGIGHLCTSCNRRKDEYWKRQRERPDVSSHTRQAPLPPPSNADRKAPVRTSEVVNLCTGTASVDAKRIRTPHDLTYDGTLTTLEHATHRSLLMIACGALSGDSASCKTDDGPTATRQACGSEPASSSTECKRSAAVSKPACNAETQPERASGSSSTSACETELARSSLLSQLPPQPARTRKPWASMTREELAPLLRAERTRSDVLTKIVAVQRKQLEQSVAAIAKGRDDAVRVMALQAELRTERRRKADRERHDLIDRATAELKAAGRRDIFSLFSKAVVSGRMPPTCIYTRRLSDGSRNVNVAPRQHRWQDMVKQHLVYVDRSASGRKALELIGSTNTRASQRGEPMPSPKLVQRWIKQKAGARAGEAVRMGFLPERAREFGEHLLRVEEMARGAEVDRRGGEGGDGAEVDCRGGEGGEGGEGGSGDGERRSLPVIPYRIACDSESVEPELHVNKRTGQYTGDEDLVQVGFGKDPRALASERKRWIQPLDAVVLGKSDAPADATAKALTMVEVEGMPALDSEVARVEAKRDDRIAKYAKRQAAGKGKPRPPPKKAPAKQQATPDGASDASGPAAGLAVKGAATAKQLVGRVLLQLFPDCPVQSTVPYRGRIASVHPIARSGDHTGEVWVSVEYEDEDAEDREVGELLASAELVPFSGMSKAELEAADCSPLLAELKARRVDLVGVDLDDASALARVLLGRLRPQREGGGGGGAVDAGGGDDEADDDDEASDVDDEVGGGNEGHGDGGEAGGDEAGGGEGDGDVPDDADWGGRVAAFNAKQVAELGQLQAAVGEAIARQSRCRALLEGYAPSSGETHAARAARLAKLPVKELRALALSLQAEIEDICATKRVAADKLILWRARDLLHNRSVTIARFWYKGQLTAVKIDAMRRHLLPRLEASLRLQLAGRAVPRLLFLVADKESCNEVLAMRGRPDAAPPTLRELGKEIETTIRAAKKHGRGGQGLPCDEHWDALHVDQRLDAIRLGFDADSWVSDDWSDIDVDWSELPETSRAAAVRLGFDAASWWGGAARLATTAAASQSEKEVARKRSALAFFRSRSVSWLPPQHFDVLGMQLHSLHPSWTAPWRSERLPAATSVAIRNCVRGAIEGVIRRRCRKSDEGAEEAELANDQKWFRALVAKHGESEATRARRMLLPHGMRVLATYLNACRPPRQQHALERSLPLLPPAHGGGDATLGGERFSMAEAYRSSSLPHTTRLGSVAATVSVMGRDSQGHVHVQLALGVRKPEARGGFVTSSQLLLERRVELAVASPAVTATVLWDVCADAEMHARRVELASSNGIRFERHWYHPFASDGRGIGHFACESHNMKTSGQLLAGMAGKKEEQVLIMHAHLLAAARSLAAADRRHVPLVAALQKTVDMHSQAVFGNLFSTRPLLDHLRSEGQWREWAVMTTLHLRWRAWDQREISRAERTRCIEVLSPLLDANLMGGAMFRPGEAGRARAVAGLPAGVRSGMFQGFSWQTISARLASAAMHAHVRERAPARHAEAWVERTTTQNDVESCFGISSKGSASKPTPLQLGPRLDELDVMDDVRHDTERATAWHVNRSKRSAYDAVEPVACKRQVVEWVSGHGDARTSARADKWEYGQRKRAIEAAAGKQETVRTDNTFRSRAVRAGAKEGKRMRVAE